MTEKQKREITNQDDFNYIETRLKMAQERVHTKVFGPIKPPTPPPAPVKQTDADIRREMEL